MLFCHGWRIREQKQKYPPEMFLSEDEIKKMGFRSVGNDVLISMRASIYNAKNISIGDNVRIDDFCILSAGDGGIEIGSHIHISCYSSLRGAGKITIEDHCTISAYTSIMSSCDDSTGAYLTGPAHPIEKRNVDSRPIIIKNHATVFEKCTILPGVRIGVNACVGAGSLVKKIVPDGEIYAGTPAKMIGLRKNLNVQRS